MKGYVEQLERIGYVLPQDRSVGFILNDLTSDFVGFVRNYNMHRMGKTLVNYMLCLLSMRKKSQNAKGKGKRKGNGKDKPVYIPKPKNPIPFVKEHLAKDDACHHYKEVGHCKRNCLAYLAKLIKKKKQVGTVTSSVSKNDVLYLNAIPRDGIYEIDILNLVPKFSGRAVKLKEIQDEDTSPSENTSEISMEVEGFELPQEEVIPVRRSARTHRALKRLCLNVEVEEHSLGDLNEPTNYKDAMLDPKSNMWLDAMNENM
uniref:Zinc finger, CCHC-type n=1 Tax=Tanacetum cinerariifolium TaxID=118510 RepID=A0A699GS26_TANCI|nr:hypothetical protein [Tanacetum cinerariifolium]